MLETSPPVTTAPTTDRRASMKRTSAFVLILFGTVGGGVSHWFVVWLLAAAYGAADLGHYSVLLAGATPIFIFLGLGLKDRSEEHTSELRSRGHLVCRLLRV